MLLGKQTLVLRRTTMATATKNATKLPKGFALPPKGEGFGVSRPAPKNGCSPAILEMLKVLQTAGCTSAATAANSADLAKAAKITPVLVRDRIYKAIALGLAASAIPPDSRGYVFWLTAQGISAAKAKAKVSR
jgi:hypothetical protein